MRAMLVTCDYLVFALLYCNVVGMYTTGERSVGSCGCLPTKCSLFTITTDLLLAVVYIAVSCGFIGLLNKLIRQLMNTSTMSKSARRRQTSEIAKVRSLHSLGPSSIRLLTPHRHASCWPCPLPTSSASWPGSACSQSALRAQYCIPRASPLFLQCSFPPCMVLSRCGCGCQCAPRRCAHLPGGCTVVVDPSPSLPAPPPDIALLLLPPHLHWRHCRPHLYPLCRGAHPRAARLQRRRDHGAGRRPPGGASGYGPAPPGLACTRRVLHRAHHRRPPTWHRTSLPLPRQEFLRVAPGGPAAAWPGHPGAAGGRGRGSQRVCGQRGRRAAQPCRVGLAGVDGGVAERCRGGTRLDSGTLRGCLLLSS